MGEPSTNHLEGYRIGSAHRIVPSCQEQPQAVAGWHKHGSDRSEIRQSRIQGPKSMLVEVELTLEDKADQTVIAS